MALLHDPAGAVFAVWEPRRHFGAAIVNAPGALSLNQLNTSDPEAAGRFYAELFGWRIERAPVEGMDYWGAYAGETLNAGMMPLPPDLGAPSHWLVYFGSEDTEADARRIGELGGTVLIPSTEVPGGTFVVAQDPQGAAFALFAGRFDP
jgi:predicted enzyme related to lactoylglutathione lyase